jgi:hypothetical protein
MTTDTSTTTAPEDRGDPRLVQEVRRFVTAGERTALLEYVTAPPSDELAEAAKWFSKGGRTLLADDADQRIHYRNSLFDSHARSMVRDVVTVAVISPADAARFLPWREMAWSRNVHVLMLLDVLVPKGDDWCRRFVAAAMARNAKAGERPAVAVIRHCLPLILHFGIDPADFEAYPRLWAFYYREVVAGHIHEVWNDEIAAKFEYPGWSGLEFRIDPAGTAVVFPKMQKSLLELWDQDLTAPTTLLRCFEVPDALGPLTKKETQKEWTVGTAVRGYLYRGTLSREEVFGKVRTALARGDGLPTQRVLADVLKSCQPSSEDVAASIPLLLSTVATAPGFLSFLAFGLLLQAPLDGGDLQGLCDAVFGRTEKKPQELLVRHLKSLRTSGTYDDGVLAACWEAAAGSSDLLIRTVAGEMLDASLAAVHEAAVHDEPRAATPLWGTGAAHSHRIPPYVPLDPATPRFLPEWDRRGSDAIAEEQALDVVLLRAYQQPQEGRDWYRRKYPVRDRTDGFREGVASTVWGWWASPDPETVMSMWAGGLHNLAEHRQLVDLLFASLSGISLWGDPFLGSSPVAAVHTLRLSELAVQAGTVAHSLATPSCENMRLELDQLVRILRAYEQQGWRYGEADFFQALLRLGPTGEKSAADVPELPVLPLDGSNDPLRAAGRLLRLWVEGGGFVPPPVGSPLVLPVPLDLFPSIPRQLVEPEVWDCAGNWHDGWLRSNAYAVVPFWPDLGAAWRTGRGGDLIGVRRSGLVGATAGELGKPTHEWLVDVLAAAYGPQVGEALEVVLALASRGQLSAEHLGAAARTRIQSGGMPLGRLVRNLALVAYEGHLDCVWPVLTALVVASSEQHKLPAGTSELLATCTELWDAIPAEHRTPETIPAEFAMAVVALAAAKSSTKTALEAKRLASRMGLQPSASP